MLNRQFARRVNRLNSGVDAQPARRNSAAMVEQLESRRLFNAVLDLPIPLALPTSNTSAIQALPTTGIVSEATVTATSVSWGTSGNAALVTQADGLRLLPVGRSTDIPWLGINKIQITLSSSAPLSPSDVTVTGDAIANYGPITISGSGTNYTLTLAQPISVADRVTLTLGNAQIATYTRRLDVLPGDANDDGVVNSQDITVVRAALVGPYNVFADIDGNGIVNSADYNELRLLIGTSLPS